MHDGGLTPAERQVSDEISPYSPDASTAAIAARLGVRRIAKLDANESAFGPFPGVAEAAARALTETNRYPDRGQELAAEIADRHSVDQENIVVTNGADPLIGYLCQAFVPPGDDVIIPTPSFVTYRQDALRHGARVIEVPVRPDGCLDLPATLEAIGVKTRIIFLCNPNNPTGGYLPPSDIADFLDAVPSHVLVALDQAYAEFVGDEPDTGAVLDLSRPNVCYLRTFSKIFGLAGLRVGYIVGPTSIAHAVGRLRHWYDVTDIAHIAATLSLQQPEEITRRREATTAARLELEQIMRNNDLEPLPSVTGFLLAPTTAVATTVLRLEEQGVLVRAVVSGTQEYLRIAVGDADDRAQLEAALQQLR
jgi:histidinol-phosphate aminotransferase